MSHTTILSVIDSSSNTLDDLHRPVHVGGIDIQMRHRADVRRAGGKHQQTMLFEFFGKGRRSAPGRINAEKNHVRVDLVGYQPKVFNLFDALGQSLGVVVIFGQTLDMMLQGIQSGRGKHSGLAHAAAKYLAMPHGLGNQILRPAKRRAHRCAQSLAETHADSVEMFGPARGFNARGYDRVKKPGPVQMSP